MTPRTLLFLIALLTLAAVASMITRWALPLVLLLGCSVAVGAFLVVETGP